jgi:hypothetical protein
LPVIKAIHDSQVVDFIEIAQWSVGVAQRSVTFGKSISYLPAGPRVHFVQKAGDTAMAIASRGVQPDKLPWN